MKSPGEAGGAPLGRTTSRMGPTWPRVAVVAGLLVLAFFVSRGCQQDEIQVTEAEAVATAEAQIDFVPEDTQIRLLRQGLDRRPFWIVSLSIPSGEGPDSFSHLALVRIDARTGEVEEVREQGAETERAQRGQERR